MLFSNTAQRCRDYETETTKERRRKVIELIFGPSLREQSINIYIMSLYIYVIVYQPDNIYVDL